MANRIKTYNKLPRHHFGFGFSSARPLYQRRACGYICYNYGGNYQANLENRLLKSVDVARLAVEAASEKQADDMVMLDTKQVCSFADYFVICSGDNPRQIEAIRQEIRDRLKQDAIIPFHIEGGADSGWILLDLGDVVVHIFSPSQRDYYRLDDLWQEAVPVVRIQ